MSLGAPVLPAAPAAPIAPADPTGMSGLEKNSNIRDNYLSIWPGLSEYARDTYLKMLAKFISEEHKIEGFVSFQNLLSLKSSQSLISIPLFITFNFPILDRTFSDSCSRR